MLRLPPTTPDAQTQKRPPHLALMRRKEPKCVGVRYCLLFKLQHTLNTLDTGRLESGESSSRSLQIGLTWKP